MANKELNTLTPKKWVGNYAGAAPTLDSSSGITRADIAIDSSTTPNKIWRCLDATAGTPIWHEIDFMNPTGFGTSVPMDFVHIHGTDETPDASDITHNNFYAEAPADGDAGLFIGDAVNGPVWYMQNYRGEKSEYWYLFNQRSGQNPIAVNTGGRIGFNNPINIMDYHSWYVNPVTGSLNDMDVSGVYTAKINAWYEIAVGAIGTPDNFKWRKSIDEGVTWGAYSANIPITGAVQSVELGILVKFDHTTGHNTNDVWRFTAHSQLPIGSHSIYPSKIDEIIHTADYTAVTPVWSDVTGHMNWSSAASVSMPDTGTKSAIYIGCKSDFNSVYVVITSAAAGMTLLAQFWNGTSWTTLTNATHDFVDATSNLTVTGKIGWDKFKMPTWAKMCPPGEDPAGYTLYWIRLISSTNITAAPVINTIVRHGKLRLAVFASPLDTVPAMCVDALGRTGIGTDSVTGNNQAQTVYPYKSRPSVTSITSISEVDSGDSSRAEIINRLSQSTATGMMSNTVAKSRGTLESPANLEANDFVGQFGFKGYIGGAWSALGGWRSIYTGNGTTNYSKLAFGINNNSSTPEDVLVISRNSTSGNGQIQMFNNTTAVGTFIEEFSIDGTMADNSDLAVPTEKAVRTYVESHFKYGEMYQTNNAVATTLTSNVWAKVLNFTAGTVSGVTYGTSDLTVTVSGVYQLIASVTAVTTNNADILRFTFGIGGTANTKFQSAVVPTTTSPGRPCPVTGIISLTAGQVVTLMCMNVGQTRNATITNANVHIVKIN